MRERDGRERERWKREREREREREERERERESVCAWHCPAGETTVVCPRFVLVGIQLTPLLKIVKLLTSIIAQRKRHCAICGIF